MVGRVKKANEVRRSGAKPGDGIYVTGSLGGSSVGLEKLKLGDLKHPSVRRHLYPEPRNVVGRAVASKAHSMIDISDGLSTDLSHIIEESKVSARIYKNLLPIAPEATDDQVLHGGEEYELLIIAPELPAEIECVPVTRIGEIIPTTLEPLILLVAGSSESVLQPEGYQHFQ
jgi:thiamine-monophosphate kinase